jgi:two-component system OmpR family sensor kinase
MTTLRRMLRIHGRSLRYQIIAVMLILLSVSFLAVGAVTAVALRTFLVERLDQQLAAAGNRFSVSLEHPSDHDDDNVDELSATEGQAAGTLGARVLHRQVTAIDIIGHATDRLVSARDTQQVAGLQPTSKPRTVHFQDLGDYRVTVSAGLDGDVLVTGLPVHPVDETIGRLLVIEASVFGAALLLAGIAAFIGVRLSLRPLDRVATTARAVSDLPLSAGTVSLPARVPVSAPDTEAGQVTEAFNHMLAHVESALYARHVSEDRLRHFIADASHELRTPIAVVRSHAEYAQRAGGDVVPTVGDALTRIVAESDRMGHLVEDLLLLVRLDSGRQLAHEPVDLTRLVLDAVSDARMVSPLHRWLLDLPERPVNSRGDEHALHQVVANLLTNAATHTPSGTTVTTAVDQSDASWTTIRVSDNGPGIPPDVLPRVFDRFVRANIARSRPDGGGLGLAIVQAIVLAHNGGIEVTSRTGSTIFTVRLPQPTEED